MSERLYYRRIDFNFFKISVILQFQLQFTATSTDIILLEFRDYSRRDYNATSKLIL